MSRLPLAALCLLVIASCLLQDAEAGLIRKVLKKIGGHVSSSSYRSRSYRPRSSYSSYRRHGDDDDRSYYRVRSTGSNYRRTPVYSPTIYRDRHTPSLFGGYRTHHYKPLAYRGYSHDDDDRDVIIPLEDLLTQLAVSTGFPIMKVPSLAKQLQYGMFFSQHSKDPVLIKTLQNMGFTYSGAPLGGAGIGGILGLGNGGIGGGLGGMGGPIDPITGLPKTTGGILGGGALGGGMGGIDPITGLPKSTGGILGGGALLSGGGLNGGLTGGLNGGLTGGLNGGLGGIGGSPLGGITRGYGNGGVSLQGPGVVMGNSGLDPLFKEFDNMSGQLGFAQEETADPLNDDVQDGDDNDNTDVVDDDTNAAADDAADNEAAGEDEEANDDEE